MPDSESPLLRLTLEERLHHLDNADLERFAHKGFEGGRGVPQAGLANGVKVRRIMQITRDFARSSPSPIRILDLGCGDGVYAIEAALRGVEVVAVDARTERMQHGSACAERLKLANLRFIQMDVRNVEPATFGVFDVVYCLGILYHFDSPDVFRVLEQMFRLCSGMLVIDTLVARESELQVSWKGKSYCGCRCREHEDQDTPEVRRAQVLRSIDNTFSFRFTRASLIAALGECGFSSVYECCLPLEPGKADDRITLVARKETPAVLSTYPWINGKTESEIEDFLRQIPSRD